LLVSAQGTAFTYQGRLNNAGAPADGAFALSFALFTTNTGGTATATLTGKRVNKRIFAATDAASVLLNTDNFDRAWFTIGGNRTLADTTGTPVDGDTWEVEVKQDGTGGRTLAVTGTNTIVSNDLGGANGTVNTVPVDSAAGRYTLCLFKYSAQLGKAVLISVAHY